VREARAARLLEGNGAALVRERSMAAAVQRTLERVYSLERTESVGEYLEAAGDGERESVLVREADDGTIELSVRVPALGARDIDVARGADLDPLCQLIEGVSHFVYIAERARADREATQLELELQAEIDKYVVLAGSVARFDAHKSAALRERLYEAVSFADDATSDAGERYRVANDLARRYVRRLEREYVSAQRFDGMREELRRFYRMGQEEKLRATRAA
jgi:hypothetical protein